MKVRIEIDTNTFVRFWLVIFGFCAVILAAYLARTALVILGTSVFLALALNRPVSALAKYVPGKRVAGTALSFVAVLIALSMLIFLVVPPIVEQTSKFIDSAPKMIQTASEQWQGVGDIVEKYHIQPQIDNAIVSLRNNTDDILNSIGKNVLQSVGSLVAFLTAALLVLVLTFLMLIEGPMWIARLWKVYNDKERMLYHKELAHKMYNVFTGYVTGQLTVSGIGGLCAGATVFLLSLFLNIPANLALPTVAIAFTLSLIPMFGATIGGVIIALLLAFNDVSAGIIFGIYFIIYQQIENNLISPNIQSKRIELSPLAVLAAVTIGLYVFGVVGGVISIPIAGCIKVLVENHFARSHKRQDKKDKPLVKLAKKLGANEL